MLHKLVTKPPQVLQVRLYVQVIGSILISANKAVKNVQKVICALEDSCMIALRMEQRLTLTMTLINTVGNPKR